MYRPIRRIYKRPNSRLPRKVSDNSEARLHEQVCNYLRYNYPDVIFISDQSGIAKSRYGASLAKKLNSNASIPDLFIAHMCGGYGGLYVELKKEGTVIKLKNGDITANPHIRSQMAMLLKLGERGYKADFGIGYAHSVSIIREYLGDPRPKPIEF